MLGRVWNHMKELNREKVSICKPDLALSWTETSTPRRRRREIIRGSDELQVGQLHQHWPTPPVVVVAAVKHHVDEQLLQLGEVVVDEVEDATDEVEGFTCCMKFDVWLNCQLDSRDPDQPACCKRDYQRSQNNLVMLWKVISLWPLRWSGKRE